MRNDYYPQGTVQALLLTDLVTSATRNALQHRLRQLPVTIPHFFDAQNFITLQAVCARLIPQPDLTRFVDVAGGLDNQLAEGKGKGWRHQLLPNDAESFINGIAGIDETAQAVFDKCFHLLTKSEQDEILGSIQTGITGSDTWKKIPSALFFEELLAAIVELYYSHPYAKEEIGEVAMADAMGWQKIGLNELEPHEPEPFKSNVHAAQ